MLIKKQRLVAKSPRGFRMFEAGRHDYYIPSKMACCGLAKIVQWVINLVKTMYQCYLFGKTNPAIQKLNSYFDSHFIITIVNNSILTVNRAGARPSIIF